MWAEELQPIDGISRILFRFSGHTIPFMKDSHNTKPSKVVYGGNWKGTFRKFFRTTLFKKGKFGRYRMVPRASLYSVSKMYIIKY